MIVPNSSISANKLTPLQKIIIEKKNCWISNYSWRPSKLFEGADMLLAIIINSPSKTSTVFTTKYHKWYKEFRISLFNDIIYNNVTNLIIEGSIPKIGSAIAIEISNKLKSNNHLLLESTIPNQTPFVIYYFRAVQYWFKVLDRIPIYSEDGEDKVTGEMKPLFFSNDKDKYVISAVLSSNLFFTYYIIWSSCQVVNSRDFNFGFNLSELSDEKRIKLYQLGLSLQNDFQKNSHVKERSYSKKGRSFTMKKQHFFIKKTKSLIDKIDKILAKHYGFTEEELDFIINYDIKYRMGDELNDND